MRVETITPRDQIRVCLLLPWAVRNASTDLFADFQTQRLCSLMREFGFDARVISLASREVIDADHGLWRDSLGNNWEMFRQDDGSEMYGPGIRSKALINWCREWNPHVIVERPPGSRIGTILRNSENLHIFHNAGSIKGMRYLDAAKFDLVFEEVPIQRYELTKILIDDVILLPKQVPTFFSYWDSAQEFDVVVISRFIGLKNHSALSPLMNLPIRIAFIGAGPLLPKYRELWGKVTADATFFGNIDPQSVAKILQRSVVLVHPSLSEGLPRAIVEALACGVPIVALRETVQWPLKNRVNSILTDESGLSLAILEILKDEKFRRRLSLNARNDFDRLFSTEVFNKVVFDLNLRIEGLVNSGRFPRRTFSRRKRLAKDVFRPKVLARLGKRKVMSMLARFGPSGSV